MWIRGIVGGAALVVGVVWIAQGVGVLRGSFMTGEAIWAVLGVPLVVVGIALLRGATRTRRRHSRELD